MKTSKLSGWTGRACHGLLSILVLGVLMIGGTHIAQAEVMGPSDVPLSSSQWNEKSPDTAAVTVRTALTNADNDQIVAAVKGATPYLNLSGSDSAGTIWWSNGADSAEIKLNIVSASGSVTASCTVSSAKGTDGKYETNCQ
ncbi:hypothetical protein [Thalassospira alkalitolerans]|uniref:Uncharacterized protein n=1 Tax=Thalassospira alkalitolerans TaxID=1293890 RepID=A0A1Y2L8W6_9PROT|nr:hypothetical protein [Thalassospira alkalitolerans]OSQ46856.1 hypothetical protein TALK_14860 [Thalassospira alkalitolerans]